MISATKYTNDGYPILESTEITVTLYDDYLVMETTTLTAKSKTTIKYKDIIGVSYSDGGAFGAAYLELNTHGRAYRHSPNIDGTAVAGKTNMGFIADAIQERIDNPEPIDTKANLNKVRIQELRQQLKSVDDRIGYWSKPQEEKDSIGCLIAGLLFMCSIFFLGGFVFNIYNSINGRETVGLLWMIIFIVLGLFFLLLGVGFMPGVSNSGQNSAKGKNEQLEKLRIEKESIELHIRQLEDENRKREF